MASTKKNPPAAEITTTKTMGPDAATVERIQAGYRELAKLVVIDQAGSEFAQSLLTSYKAEQKRLQAERLDITRDLDNAKKKIIELYRPIDTLLDRIIQDTGRKIIAYDTKVREEAAERQRKLDAEVEAQRKRDLALAEKARKRGDEERADEFEQRAETRVAPVVPVQSAAAPGRAFVDVWGFVIVDASKLKREYLMPDEKKIGAIVRSLHQDAASAVGDGAIKITSERTVRG